MGRANQRSVNDISFGIFPEVFNFLITKEREEHQGVELRCLINEESVWYFYTIRLRQLPKRVAINSQEILEIGKT